MKRFFTRDQERDGEGSEINLSPLIDMVFILLIFFLVTTVFVEETGIEIERPEAAAAVPQDRQSIQIAISAEGGIFFDGEDIGLAGVRPLVRRLNQAESRPVLLQVDEQAPAGLAVRVIDAATLGGAPAVSLSARPPS